MKDKDPLVRIAAAGALGALRDPQALPRLRRALKNKDPLVRGAAAEALGQLHDPRALPRLLQALKNEDEFVRRAAAKSIGKLSPPEGQRGEILEDLAAMARSADFPPAEAAFEALWGLLTGETD
ncbi:HEAT repeat domain-containing protein [Thermoflexus sp.]|uniref:HEAT repeat domain-containing protein n=1 Tax=Thermoflexus sp. TaxID=1969742 RepID=UPI0025F4A89F|nr:HEAT repeat domain-containing protein [Thermoflexus sp.]MDW8179521.1 HEAT repeat domain-containing protein [Anaerolineae bacterium]MCS6964028.1 HEAT repeat domain-containing protein [Thermoflexus sp.]MCS7350072.1 HEAT repeat domain-containing protein [Thermoflexus sp.]MCX7689436.1 HEAT repeat domain-containing protein [Thermoflexus sp.]MDW8185572.1 HEAT repeat domain-containing protein [Anaerolineae bacterium]